ncbi:hypothetical protein ACIRCZ_18670 [Leifsonia sp. NPDC102414]|uniref:hypothetical protein n=1 Tax=Leifsonia sp. NPDC102414 TaxID=3364124 RepID=UPI0038218527
MSAATSDSEPISPAAQNGELAELSDQELTDLVIGLLAEGQKVIASRLLPPDPERESGRRAQAEGLAEWYEEQNELLAAGYRTVQWSTIRHPEIRTVQEVAILRPVRVSERGGGL